MYFKGGKTLFRILARALREKYLLKESNLSQGPWDELIKKRGLEILPESQRIFRFLFRVTSDSASCDRFRWPDANFDDPARTSIRTPAICEGNIW